MIVMKKKKKSSASVKWLKRNAVVEKNRTNIWFVNAKKLIIVLVLIVENTTNVLYANVNW